MAETTRAPLPPLGKGSLARLWLALAAAILGGAALAFVTVPESVSVTTIKPGLGQSPQRGDVAFVRYTGKLADGTVFEQSRDLPLPVPGILPQGTPMLLNEGDTIAGFVEGVLRMQKGGRYTLRIPAEKAYGAQGSTNPMTGQQVIPPDADLVFDIELIDFMSREDVDRRFAAIRQMMQAQQQKAGTAGSATAPVE